MKAILGLGPLGNVIRVEKPSSKETGASGPEQRRLGRRPQVSEISGGSNPSTARGINP